jgi:hypothetical protein
METSRENRFKEVVDAFLATSAPIPPKPGQPIVPTEAELDLLRSLENFGTLTLDDVAETRVRIDLSNAWRLFGFALRMSLHAAQSNSPSILKLSFIGFVLDPDLLDYRDILVRLSMVEDIANRLNVNFIGMVESMVTLASENRARTLKDYLNRTPKLRSLATMGLIVSGSGPTLGYSTRPWT